VEHADNLLSTLSIIGVRSSIHGFVVPIGSPRYVNGIEPTSQPNVLASRASLSCEILMEYMCDFL